MMLFSLVTQTWLRLNLSTEQRNKTSQPNTGSSFRDDGSYTRIPGIQKLVRLALVKCLLLSSSQNFSTPTICFLTDMQIFITQTENLQPFYRIPIRLIYNLEKMRAVVKSNPIFPSSKMSFSGIIPIGIYFKIV